MKAFIAIMFLTISFNLISETIITYRGAESDADKRMEYPLALLKEALEITKAEYGNYILQPSIRMNSKRAESLETANLYVNYIVEASVTLENEQNLLSIKIPTTKGLFGYRVFLIMDENTSLFKNILSMDDLSTVLLGQGSTWLDTKILENSGFRVIKGRTYEQIIKMLNAGRIEGFPRGINEAFKEVELLRKDYINLKVEETLCIYYPLPKFFYTAKKNVVLHERITKGLLLMIDNGSFDRIWREFNAKYIEEAKLNNRTIYRIENKFIPDVVPFNDKKFWFEPDGL